MGRHVVVGHRAAGVWSAVSCLVALGVEFVAYGGASVGIHLPHWGFVVLFWVGIICLVLALVLAICWLVPVLNRRRPGRQPPPRPINPATLAVLQKIGELGQTVAAAEYLGGLTHVTDGASATQEQPSGRRIGPGNG